MGHLKQLDSELRDRLAEGDTEALIKWVKDEVLRSYRNGLATRAAAGKEGEEAAQKSSRR